jgi:hypothetical protein
LQAPLGALLRRRVLKVFLPALQLEAGLDGELAEEVDAVLLVLAAVAVILTIADERVEDALTLLALELFFGTCAGAAV